MKTSKYPFPTKWIPLGITLEKIDNLISLSYSIPNITPSKENLFRSLELIEPSDVKVIIIGQDPYPTKGDADGLAFSTRATKTPRSLSNIFKVIKGDYPNVTFESNSLDYWAKQGVLLINTTLTCEIGKPASHSNIGWQKLTTSIIQNIISLKHVIIVAWGNQAQKLASTLKGDFVLITSSHPSPLSFSKGKEPFKDSHMFLKINQELNKLGYEPIDWSTKRIAYE